MNWAIFSDVHANLEALTAVKADAKQQGVTRFFFLGDAVGYGASPNECLGQIGELAEVCILGNHDQAVLGSGALKGFNEHARAAILWTRATITNDAREKLQTFVMEHQTDEFQLVHASPHNPECWDYIVDPWAAREAFAGFDGPLCLIGHTHQPLVIKNNKMVPQPVSNFAELAIDNGTRYLVNVGSVGQPRDKDPRACYVLFDPETHRLKYRRVAYDLAAAQAKMRQAALPEGLIKRLGEGR